MVSGKELAELEERAEKAEHLGEPRENSYIEFQVKFRRFRRLRCFRGAVPWPRWPWAVLSGSSARSGLAAPSLVSAGEHLEELLVHHTAGKYKYLDLICRAWVETAIVHLETVARFAILWWY